MQENKVFNCTTPQKTSKEFINNESKTPEKNK